MDDAGNPWLIVLLSVVIVLLLLIVIGLLITFRRELKKKLQKAMRSEKEENLEEVTEEEIMSMVNEGHEKGVLLESEAQMIHNIFEFGDKEVKDIMNHRKNVIAIDGELSYNDAVDIMIENNYSRYPVYVNDIDNIIGVIHIKEALAHSKHNEVFRTPIKDIHGLIREVSFIPETRNINTLFTEMQTAKNHMAVVVDEYGQTSGIVAMEDILEEIVGNIQDEHDEEETLCNRMEDGTYIMDGMTPLEEVIDEIHIPVEEDEFDTLNGLLISLLDKIPAEGELPVIVAYGYEFRVLSVENKMMKQIQIVKQPETCEE